VTLLATSVNSSFDASQFAGVKGVVTFHPFGRGFEVSVGGSSAQGQAEPRRGRHGDHLGLPARGRGSLEIEFSF
jgi:hypothetical protein